MSYLETLFSQECPSIFKQYQAEFTKHGFDTPSTIKLLCYDDLLQKFQVRDFRRNFVFDATLRLKQTDESRRSESCMECTRKERDLSCVEMSVVCAKHYLIRVARQISSRHETCIAATTKNNF